MMIHLESGACVSGVDCTDIDSWMFDGHCTARFLNDWGDDYLYTCPDCDTNFRFASALLQHIESNACDENIGDAVSSIKSDMAWRI